MNARIALLCDSPDEHWPSMDTVGTMLSEQLPEAERIAPAMRAVTPNLTINRIWLRFVDYPRWLRRNRRRFDLFHIVDHSYSQLAHALPAGRTVITCHDIDTFRCILEPERDPRSFAFRAMTKRILSGFQKAAHVTCDSGATLADLARHGVLPLSRMSVVPLGAHPSCSPDPNPPADAQAESLLGRLSPLNTDLLHVGSTIDRKRIDILLRVVAELRRAGPSIRLIRAGGAFTVAQAALARELGIADAIVHLPFLSRDVLSAVYRRSALVLQPSEAEGFGLPVAEAMACGTPVLASDLAVLREVGGDSAFYCPVANIPLWTAEITRLLAIRKTDPAQWQEYRNNCLSQAALFSWRSCALRMMAVYNKILNGSKHET